MLLAAVFFLILGWSVSQSNKPGGDRLSCSPPTSATARGIPTELRWNRDLMLVTGHPATPKNTLVVNVHQMQHPGFDMLEHLVTRWGGRQGDLPGAMCLRCRILIGAGPCVRALI